MAKLVEILAKELGEWPEGYGYIAQDGKRLEFQIAAYKTAPVYVSGEWQAAGNLECGDYLYPTECTDPATDHATAIVTREMWQAERKRAVTGMGVSGESVGKKYMDRALITMRDRIREIDATIEAMTAERAELVSKLAGEGFALIAGAVDPVEDMSDWRNWKAGDYIECIIEPIGTRGISAGQTYKLTGLGRDSIYFRDDDDDCRDRGDTECFKFHSRPSA